jgi:hypothetical protein
VHWQAVLPAFGPLLLRMLVQTTQILLIIALVAVVHKQLKEVKSHVKAEEQTQLFPEVAPVACGTELQLKHPGAEEIVI